MFYSQFILAKKGPLGTIWIAAHLERKLKKNQVADTDIGDSVDSILSPDVPIALRLSSHLLLGVVRIYSRKVNYLFHDCSETLLKVKQALCSTTVDLPPEESTAPYHSITLPETFDLDDFELPDSAALNGNLDDRHVSSREQITLQNTLDGTEYSISQFELDERFGDGDVSQIGLDLDEELMLDNNLKHQHDPVSYGDAHKGEGTGDLTKMDIDEAQLGGDEDRNNEASRELSELLCNDHGKHVISDDAHKGEGASDLARMDIDEPQLVGDEERNNEASTELSELLCNDQGKHVISDHAFKGEGANDLAKVDIDEAQLGGADDRNKEVSTELSELLCNDRGKHVISDVQNANRIDDSSHRLVFSIRTPDLNEVSLPDDHIDDPIGGPSAAPNIGMDFAAAALPSLEFDEFANIPSMPILANCQKLPSSNPQEILPYTTDLANGKLDKPINQEIECPDATNKNLVNTSLTNRKLDNIAQAVSSPTSNLDEPKSVAPQCSGGIFPSLNPLKEVHHIHNDSIDATNSGNRVSSESTDPKLSEVSRLLPSSTSVLPEAVSVSQVPRCSDGTVDTPGWVGLESTLRTINNSDAGIVWNEADTVPLSVDNGIPYEDTSRLSNLDQRRVEEANSYQTNDFSVLSSDFQMRSCTSVSNQANLTFPGDMLLKKTPGFSSRDQPCNLETPAVDQELYFSGSSLGQPGFPSVAIDNNFRSHQKSNYIQLGHPNCFSSSKFSEPERMLYAPSGNFNLSSDLGLQTIEKVVVESDGSVDRISNLHGKKRRLLDNTPESQNGISPNMSGIPPKKRNNDYNDYIIHKEDDLLASILDGRRTPALKIGPTPPLPKPPSSKRPRLTQKVCLPKRRKVLLDDATVVHAEAIRQQLMNTEDIRRMRRTAPCARPEIWRIQKSFTVEDDIFCESIFLGISDELSSLPRRYDPVQNMHAQANGQHSSGEAIKEFEVSKSSPLVRDDDGREITVHTAVVTKSVHGEIRGASGGELIGAESCLIDVSVDAHEQIESTFVVPFDSKIEENRNDGLADVEHNSLSREFRTSQEAEVNDTALDTATYVSFKEFTSAVTDGASVKVQDLSNAKASSISVEHMGADVVNVTNLECPQEEQAGMIKDHSDGASTSMLDKFVVEVSADFPDSSTVIEHVGSVCGDAVVDGKRAASEDTCGEMPNVVSFPVPPSTEGERAPSPVGENSCMNAEGGLDVESTPVELASTRESSDFCCAVDNIDTDFLNVDDEDAVYDEETINDAPHTEAAQSLENSGWSSRTRGVARYLRTVFDQESGRARKFVAVDHLLAGKTRKEASRMFFETLVLKTRDYIHVEQDDPFSCINIKPRINLLKTEF